MDYEKYFKKNGCIYGVSEKFGFWEMDRLLKEIYKSC